MGEVGGRLLGQGGCWARVAVGWLGGWVVGCLVYNTTFNKRTTRALACKASPINLQVNEGSRGLDGQSQCVLQMEFLVLGRTVSVHCEGFRLRG